MNASDALDIIRAELEPLPERLLDQLARESDPQRVARALQVARREALGRIVGPTGKRPARAMRTGTIK